MTYFAAGDEGPSIMDRISTFLELPSCGQPKRPLLEAGLVFAAFYLVSYLPADPSVAGRSLGQPLFHILIVTQILPKTLLLLYLMARSEGLAAFGATRPRAADSIAGLFTAVGAAAIVALPTLVLSAFGLKNPLLGASSHAAASAYLVVPLVLASCLAVGYGEELFFRSYLMRRLGQAGLAPPWAALASSLVFGSAHGIQGLLGLSLATILGLWFAWRWIEGGRIHEIALGHAMYDAAVILYAVFG